MESLSGQELFLGPYLPAVRERIGQLEREGFGIRLWEKDPGLWKEEGGEQGEIQSSLGWLNLPEEMEGRLGDLRAFSREMRLSGFQHVLHTGMGGSSLAPLVLGRTMRPGKEGLPVTVLDTTDPATILKLERSLPLERTLYILASKSGTTAEPLAFGDYFWAKLAAKGKAGGNFVAITDPGTPLVESAREREFRRTFLSSPEIGGRYSALSYFGLVPAALMDLPIEKLLARSRGMLRECRPHRRAGENPGLVLGAALGELARRGRNKLTFLLPPEIAPLGMWLEQLLAESTGKEGLGILPVSGEPLGEPAEYGRDRIFVLFRLKENEGLEKGAAALKQAGHPVVKIRINDLLDLGREFYRWEIATAAAGVVLGVNPFDQPDVQESKEITHTLLSTLRAEGKLVEDGPGLADGPLRLFAPEGARSASQALSRLFSSAREGDYLALLAYLPESPAVEEALQGLRSSFRRRLHLATTLGYGPRYLHSTGQFHKGGPDGGIFVQITGNPEEDAPIPGQPYTFGTFQLAQALGDLEALRRRRRRVVRLHLETGTAEGLPALEKAWQEALER